MLSLNGNLIIHIKTLDCTCLSCYGSFTQPNIGQFWSNYGHFKGKVGSPGLVGESSRAQALFWTEPGLGSARLLQTLVFSRCVGKRCTVYTMFIVYFKLYNTLRLLYLIARPHPRRTHRPSASQDVQTHDRRLISC